jgi:hypothetical protein
MVYWTDPSKVPALLSDEGFEIGRRDPDGVEDADMRQVPLVAQPVHGRRAYAEAFSHLANGEQRRLHSSVW